ncbi:MAG: LPS export ABC transporter periplasmic protein LptC [Halobacteriovoraceae bacterium]|jgi:lipopolysaccharide export system protein LptA|nr:LPS export ABC transporter periplasmic protein LptC [Halobacteriovoraceae bacterium]
MVSLQHSIIAGLFAFFCVAVVVFSQVGNWNTVEFQSSGDSNSGDLINRESYFSKVNYFKFRKGIPFLHLQAFELNISTLTKKTIFLNPKGMVFTNKGVPINYQGQQGIFFKNKEELFLEKEVTVKMKNSTIASDKMVYKFSSDQIISTGGVESSSRSERTGDVIQILSDKAIFWPKSSKSKYLGNVQGEVKRGKVYEENVSFKSDRLRLDLGRHKMELYDNVSFLKQELSARSRRGEVFLENYNKKLKYFVLYDDVKVIEQVVPKGSRKGYTREAFAEKLEGLISENKVILTGRPKVFQQKDIIKGNRIVLRKNNEVIEVEEAITIFDRNRKKKGK